jgi:hypothetical protein
VEFKDLTPEQREKALNCKSPEEILNLAKEAGYELNDEELAGVTGGWGDPNCKDLGECKDYCYRLYSA